MVAETGRPPVLQQARREAMDISTDFQIAVVDQDIERVRNTPGGIVDQLRIQAFQGPPRARSEYILESRRR